MKWTFSRRRAAARTIHARRGAEPLERRVLLNGGTLLADINATTDQLDPSQMVVAGDVVYFAGRPAVGGGAEVFKTDGTTEGTVLVKDIVPGIAGSDPRNFTVAGGTIFFSAADTDGGRELWKTDGTAAGTVRVKDIRPGTTGSDPVNLTAVGDTVFFAANDGTRGAELWKSDGTDAGTTLVKDITPGSSDSSPAYLVNVGGALLFSAGGSSSKQLYRSDGTPDGTVVVPVPSSASNRNPRFLTVMNDVAYFAADPGGGSTSRSDLYRSDGTPAGTYRVRQFNPGSSADNSVAAFVASGDLMYFLSSSITASGYELWRTDGTDAGTIRLISRSTSFGSFSRVTPLGNGSAVFPFTTSTAGMEPWVSNGTPAGTRLVQQLAPGAADGVGTFVGVTVDGVAYFAPNVVYGKPELWATDGSSAWQVADRTDPGGVLAPLVALGERVLLTGLRFVGEGDLYAYSTWTGETTRIGATQGPGGAGNGYSMNDTTPSNTQSPVFFRAGPYVYFEATDGITGDELWRTNPGAVAGEPPVVQVADISPGGHSSEPGGFAMSDDGTVYFTATTLAGGRELYRVGPGGIGAELVRDLAPGAASAATRTITAIGNVLYFTARDGETNPFLLWRYDPANGSMTKVFTSGATTLTGPSALVRAGPYWYFSATGSTLNGRELFRTDGTVSGTRLVKDVVPGSTGSNPDDLTAFNGKLLFSATVSGKEELWSSDGTDAGTVKVTDFGAASGTDAIRGIFAHGDSAYVIRGGTGAVPGLWRTDGTPAGTVKVSSHSGNGQFAAAGDEFYFAGSDAAGAGVFRFDPATNAVTRFIAAPGTTGFVASTLYAAGGDVYAVGTADGQKRFELWRIDGDAPTAAGPAAASRVRVLGPRVTGGVLSGYFLVGRYALAADDANLYFPAYTPENGMEPYVLPLGQPSGGYVVGRGVFYANSPSAGVSAAPDKRALLPGEAATSANVTTYDRGLNGLTVDLTGVPAGVALDSGDFQLAVMSAGSGATWVPLSVPATVTARRGEGAGGSDRFVLTLPDNVVRNAWLRVTVTAGARTGLLAPDVFYFGNLPGDGGDAAAGAAAMVSSADVVAARRKLGAADAAARERFDFNRDGRVNVLDVAIARGNVGRTLPALTAPPAAAAPSAAAILPPVRSAETARSRPVARRGVWAEQIING